MSVTISSGVNHPAVYQVPIGASVAKDEQTESAATKLREQETGKESAVAVNQTVGRNLNIKS